MNSVVTERFIHCLEKLMENRIVRSKRQFAHALEYLPQGISEIVNGRRDVTIELLRKAVDVYDLNPQYLLSGTGSIFSQQNTHDLNVLTIVTDKNDQERIIHVPVPAQAGYVEQFHNPEYVQNLPTYRLPDSIFDHGTYRSFDVSGLSMEPVFFTGDKVICSYIESNYWKQAIKDQHFYVIVTDEGVVVKRVINRFRESQSLELISENFDYPPYLVHGDQIREVWKVRLKITSKLEMNEVSQSKQSRLKEINGQLARQNEMIQSLVKQIGGSA